MGEHDTAGALRDVGGRLVSSVITDARGSRIEVLRRQANHDISWRFRQPVPTLFWYRRGMRSFRLDIDGRRLESSISPASSLTFYPAGVMINGAFTVDDWTDYTVAFLDTRLAADRGVPLPRRPIVGFAHQPLVDSLRRLTTEADHPDSMFELYAERWALQALVHLGRMARDLEPDCRAPERATGLDQQTLHEIERYVHANLAARITLDDLAKVAGYSGRHLMRLFTQSLGQPPLRYVHSVRIEAARQLLGTTDRLITSIARDCGFSQIHHFSSAFRAATGTSPRAFRREHRG